MAGWHHSGVHVWWVDAMVGLACHGKVFVRQVGIVVGIAHCDKVVAVDLHVVKGGGGGYGLCVAR